MVFFRVAVLERFYCSLILASAGVNNNLHLDSSHLLFEPRHDYTNTVAVPPEKTQISLGISSV